MSQFEMFNGLTTSEISDALDSCNIEGALIGIHSLKPGCRLIGKAFTVHYKLYVDKPSAFQGAADYIDEVPEGSVIVIDNAGRDNCTTWGGILTDFAQSRKIAGTVLFGSARDIGEIRNKNYPLFCSATYMRSGKNRVYKFAQQTELIINGVSIMPNDIIFADDNGVLVIPSSRLDEVVHKAKAIQQTEEKIILSIRAGIPLVEARKRHGYATPWIQVNDENA